MANAEFTWIYLIFFLIPLAKILPRLIKKWKTKNSNFTKSPKNQSPTSNVSFESLQDSFKIQHEKNRHDPTNMLVLGELSRGTKNFDAIQKKLSIDTKTLDVILEDFENQGLIRVDQKKGLFGLKVELYPTEEGLKKYYS